MKKTQNARSFRFYAGYASIIAVTLALIAAAIVEWRYGVFIPTLRAKPPFDTDRAGAYVVVDPSYIKPLIPEIAGSPADRAPEWLINRFLPYQAGGGALLDMEERHVALTGYLNAKRLAPLLAREVAKVDLRRAASKINWAGPAFEDRPGLLVADGSIPFDPDAEETFGSMWSQSLSPQPLTLEGGHFVEGVLDNRRGHGYLIIASFLKAYDIDLSRNEHDISIASFQFLRDARFTADFAAPDSFKLRLVLNIVPDAIDRVGVVNLKVGIEESINDLAGRWHNDHGLELTGAARWEDTSIVYEYTLKSARKFLELVRDGELKK